MATVWPHGRKVAVRFRVKGKPLTTTLDYYPTKAGLKAARAAAEDAEHRLRAGESWESVRAGLRGDQAPRPLGSLGYYAQHFLDHHEAEHSTLMAYQSAYNRYWIEFDERPIHGLLRTELEAHLAKFTVRRKTKRNAVSVLRRIMDVARRDRAFADGVAPTDGWEIKKDQKAEPDPYTEAERDKLLAALKDRNEIAWRYFLMAFHSGMRTGELLGLEWRQVEKPHVTVDQSRVRRRIKRSTKTDEARRVRLPPLVWDMLDANPTRFKRGFVFLSPEGRAFLDADWLMEHWRAAHKKAGVRRRTMPYPWRHTYISLGLAAGQSLIWMSKQTGHDMRTMERDYARWIEGRDDADRLEMEKVYR